MKIVLSGGGTGGHITPTLAVAHELKRLRPDCRITYIIERKAKFGALVTADGAIDSVRYIYAGKLRRYHGESWLRRLTDVKTITLNLRDVLFLTIGLVQSLWLLGRLKPDAVFIKGGYVGLPVGVAAALWHRPIVTHDSDTLPGLTNRIVARWARAMATAFPADFYTYPVAKLRYVGVPVAADFAMADTATQSQLRQKLGVPINAQVIFITGGSLGAMRLNEAIVAITPHILERYPNAFLIHQTGKGRRGMHGQATLERVVAQEFVEPLSSYSGAADIVVARPGATTIAELAAQGRAAIMVPSPVLADGHQLKNAAHLAAQGSAIVANEGKNLQADLLAAIQDLLDHPEKRQQLAQKIHTLYRPNAAKDLAMLLLEQTKT